MFDQGQIFEPVGIFLLEACHLVHHDQALRGYRAQVFNRVKSVGSRAQRMVGTMSGYYLAVSDESSQAATGDSKPEKVVKTWTNQLCRV
ncbi:hypothetical protein HBI55_241740 [Parastagonospora nodorum]|nr:hypothetical protein HBI55_241740 [Parastagonospora nodorum]